MILHDIRYAIRTLANNPVFTVTAVATIALGIGSSAAIFSVANAVLLRGLPYKDARRLVTVTGEMKKRGAADLPLPVADYFDLRNGAAKTFEEFATVNTGRTVMPREDGSMEQVR